MRHHAVAFPAALTALLVPVAARAQGPNQPLDPPPTWEIELTTQFMPGTDFMFENLHENERVIGESSSLGVGHFFSPHLRAFAAIGTRRNDGTFGADSITPTSKGTLYDLYEERGAVFTSSLTWQFRENAMVHPYVSAGVNVGAYQHDQRLDTVSGTTYRSQMLSQEDKIEVRPVFSLGAKTYFGGGHWYMRPEAAVALGSTGVARGLVRIGLGRDF